MAQVSAPDVPVRYRGASWERRRASYREWLASPGSFCLVAEEAGAAVGYALVRLEPGNDTWETDDPQAGLETLAVLPEARGRGIGTELMDAVDGELDRLGVRDLMVVVAAANEDALRFYRARGMAPLYVDLYQRRSG